MKNNYIIPYSVRSTEIGDGHKSKTTLMCVDNVGIVVKHKQDYIPTDDDVRRHLIGYHDRNKILIKADSIQEAMQIFFDFPECKCGTKYKAWELVDSDKNPVIEYSGCEHLQQKEGTSFFNCQRFAEEGEWENLICVLDGQDDPHDDCIIHRQMQEIGYKSEVITVGGIAVKRFITPEQAKAREEEKDYKFAKEILDRKMCGKDHFDPITEECIVSAMREYRMKMNFKETSNKPHDNSRTS